MKFYIKNGSTENRTRGKICKQVEEEFDSIDVRPVSIIKDGVTQCFEISYNGDYSKREYVVNDENNELFETKISKAEFIALEQFFDKHPGRISAFAYNEEVCVKVCTKDHVMDKKKFKSFRNAISEIISVTDREKNNLIEKANQI